MTESPDIYSVRLSQRIKAKPSIVNIMTDDSSQDSQDSQFSKASSVTEQVAKDPKDLPRPLKADKGNN